MDVYSYINSKDIREHLREIKYQFSTSEIAFLVYLCGNITLEEKINAWEYVTDNFPDGRLDARYNMPEISSLHTFLKNYIELLRKSAGNFYHQDKAIYKYMSSCDSYESRPFSNWNTCRAAIEKEEKFDTVKVEKVWVDWPGQIPKSIRITMNKEFEIMQVYENYLLDEETDLALAFEGMWFLFPTPFKRGDILTMYDEDEPFVLDFLGTWNAQKLVDNGFSIESGIVKSADNRVQRFIANGDTTDMWANGYVLCDVNGICEDVIATNYLNLEYYRKPLDANNRVLKKIAYALKKKTV